MRPPSRKHESEGEVLTTVHKLAERIHCAASPATRDALVRQYIEQDPNRPGVDEARTKEDAIPVWALVSYLEGLDGNIDAVVEDYGISPETVDAVLIYFLDHSTEITARIQANRLPKSILVR